MHSYPDASAVVRALAPDEPVILNRPHAAARAARFFVEKFPGKSLYAVKANPSPELLKVLWASGVTHYDVASIAEVRLVRATLPEATLCFMHPVKTRAAIAEAYRVHGVRTFSLDTREELDKIVAATTNEAGEPATWNASSGSWRAIRPRPSIPGPTATTSTARRCRCWRRCWRSGAPLTPCRWSSSRARIGGRPSNS